MAAPYPLSVKWILTPPSAPFRIPTQGDTKPKMDIF